MQNPSCLVKARDASKVAGKINDLVEHVGWAELYDIVR